MYYPWAPAMQATLAVHFYGSISLRNSKKKQGEISLENT
jgi:hypothetical protein